MYRGIIRSCCTESELSKNSGVNYYVNPTPQPRLGAGAGAVFPPLPASSGSLSDFLCCALFMQCCGELAAMGSCDSRGRKVSGGDEQPG